MIPQHVAMLHHLVFTNGGPDNRRGDRACPFNATRERFYGTSEELRPLTLPRGYGYPTEPGRQLARAADGDAPPRRRARVLLEYRVTVDPRPVIAVKPYWLSVIPCVSRPAVVGARATAQGPHRRSREFTMPEAGRIVAVGGHLHGGALALDAQPAGLRRPHARALQARATRRQGRPAVRGPRRCCTSPIRRSISWWQSATGWPIRAARAPEGHRRLRRLAPAHARDGDRARLRRAARARRTGAALRARAAARRADPRPRLQRRALDAAERRR